MYRDPDSYTPFQKLWENVAWGAPLFLYNVANNLGELGDRATVGDEHDYAPGPMEYWYKELESGKKIVLQHPIDYPKEEDFLNVYSDSIEIDEIIEELNLSLSVGWRADSNEEAWKLLLARFKEIYCWNVLRLDDNDNTFIIQKGLSESGAKAEAFRYEKKGHKQTYWAEKNVL